MLKNCFRGWSARGSNRHIIKIFLVMKLAFVLIIAFMFNVSATGLSQSITISGKNVPLKSIFSTVKKQSGVVFLYSESVIDKLDPIAISAKNMPLAEFLKLLFKDLPLKYSIDGKSILVSARERVGDKEAAHRMDALLYDSLITVRGRVLNAANEPMAGVSVMVVGTQKGTNTDDTGSFELKNVAPTATLEFSFVGMKTIREKLNGRGSVVVQFTNEVNDLKEAVVYNGYQKIQQKFLTGAVTSLQMDSILQPGLSTVDKMLEGRVPGMMFMQNSGQAGAAPKLRIRGTNTYLGSREPLWVVDGIIRTNPIPVDPQRLNDPDFVNLLGNAISGLNPYDIEQIDVLKDATAAALYGVRAANGVIVITTKRGKPGPPTVNYHVTSTFTQRPRYTDKSMYMMDSRERVDVSREMIEKQLTLRGGALEAYEKAIVDYYGGALHYNAFKENVDKAESMNTDWMGNTMRDVFATNHTVSVSGGTAVASYRASVGYRNEPGVIKKEKSDLYTGLLNMQLNYKKFKVELNVQLNKENRHYTPTEIGLLNYAYGTSRAIPLYNEDGSLYFYSTLNSTTRPVIFNDLKKMNILNELNNTGQKIENNEYNGSIDLSYEIARGIQFHTKLAYTGGNSSNETWFGENTQWATLQRDLAYNQVLGVYDPVIDPMPYGGELREQAVKRQNYILNGRLNFNRFIDLKEQHMLSVQIAADVNSNRYHSFSINTRGYFQDRGKSFASIDLSKQTGYAGWLSENGRPAISELLQNSLRSYITSSYIFKGRYVIAATASQEFSNSFGSRSNEKFLPTWALSGRWNLHEDLMRQLSWVDQAALLLSFGTRGNMLQGQTPYATFTKGPVNTYYGALSSTIHSFPNPDLAWEKTQDYNGTLQFAILQGRINGSFGYFFSRTTNAFLEKKVSAVDGAPANSYVVNGGTLENQGVELSLNFKIIDNKGAGNKNRFIWRFDPQLGQVFNKLINNNLNSRNVMVDAASLTYQDYLNGRVPINGKSVNTFYSYQFKTLDPNFGYPVFYGAEPENKQALKELYDKLKKDEVFSLVMVESGRREPVLQGGINNSFVYGNWTLNVTFTYSVGNKIRLMQIASGNYGTFRPSSQQNLRKEFTQRWRYPGDEQFTNIPAIQGNSAVVDFDKTGWWNGGSGISNRFATDYYQMYDFSDLRVVKGDYLKLQYVSLSYRLSNELCKRLNCKGAMAQLSGTNLFTMVNKALRGQDPSQSGTAPNINLAIRPTYAFNINLSF